MDSTDGIDGAEAALPRARITVSTRTFSSTSLRGSTPRCATQVSCGRPNWKAREKCRRVDFYRGWDSHGFPMSRVDWGVEGGLAARRERRQKGVTGSIPVMRRGCLRGYHLFAYVGGCSTRIGSGVAWGVMGRAPLGGSCCKALCPLGKSF